MINKIKSFIFDNYLEGSALEEIREIFRLEKAERFKLSLVENNTALVEDADKYIEQQKGIIKAIEGQRKMVVSQKLKDIGIEQGQKVDINLETGRVKFNVDKSDNKEE